MSCHFGIAVGSKWSKGHNMPTQQEELNKHTLVMFPTLGNCIWRGSQSIPHRLGDQIMNLSWEAIAAIHTILNSLQCWWQPFWLIRGRGRARRSDTHVFPCGSVSPTMTCTAFVSMLQATLLLAAAAVSPPAVSLSGSTAEYQSVLTWHKSCSAVY